MMDAGRSPLHGALAWRRLLAAVSLACPLMAALLVQGGADDRRSAGIALLLEPVLVGVGLYLACLLAAHRRWSAALALALGGVGGLALLHTPPAPLAPPVLPIPWADQVGACLDQADESTAPVRVLTWHTAHADVSAADIARLAAQRPDVVVLTSLRDPGPLAQLSAAQPGEVHTVGSPGDQLGIYVRGIFLDCHGASAIWPLTVAGEGSIPRLDAEDRSGLADSGERSAAGRMALALPRIQGVGVVPLLAFEVPMPDADVASGAWPGSAAAGAQALAAVALLGDTGLVAAGHLAALPGMKRTAAILAGAGLRGAGGPPTWPARIGSLPFLAQFRTEGVLTGPRWRSTHAEAVLMDGAHRALLIELEVDDGGPPLGEASEDGS